MSENEAQKEEVLVAVPPESGFSMNWTMVDGLGVNVQITMRAALLSEWGNVLKARKAFLDASMQHGWTVPNRPQSALANEPEAVKIARDAGAAPEVVAAVAAATNGNGQKQAITLRAVYWEVKPDASGKVKIDFFGDDKKQPHNQFADVYATKPIDYWKQQLPQIDPKVWGVVGSYNTPLEVKYVLSDKLNSKGNPYKDLLGVSLHRPE